MSNIYVSGSLAYDHIMDMPGLFKDYFVADKLHNINVSFFVPDHAEHFGGTAGNIAYNLALLNEKPSIISTAGNDFERYEKHLREFGVPSESIHISADKPTAFAYIVTDKADNQIAAFHPGANGLPYGAWKPEQDSLAVIAPGCLDDIRAFPELYHGNGVRFCFDPGQIIPSLTADELRNGMSGAEAVFGNDYEFALVKTATGWDETEVVKHAKAFIITLGGDGSRVITKEGETRVAAAKVSEVKDPTGAGDAYRAGYLKGLRLGWPPAKCAQLGSVVAAFAVEHVGTQSHRFTLDELAARYNSAYGETLSF
jgi:adenosine kinase